MKFVEVREELRRALESLTALGAGKLQIHRRLAEGVLVRMSMWPLRQPARVHMQAVVVEEARSNALLGSIGSVVLHEVGDYRRVHACVDGGKEVSHVTKRMGGAQVMGAHDRGVCECRHEASLGLIRRGLGRKGLKPVHSAQTLVALVESRH